MVDAEIEGCDGAKIDDDDDDGEDEVQDDAEMQKVIKIAEINFWPKKISTKKWPKNDPKLPKMAQK